MVLYNLDRGCMNIVGATNCLNLIYRCGLRLFISMYLQSLRILMKMITHSHRS
jgi:hypothetical protein